MMDFIITIIGQFSPTIGEMYSYHRNYETNVRKFEEKVEDLVAGKEGVQQLVDEAKRNRQTILNNVENWLKRADECIEDGRKFLEDGNDENQIHLSWLFPGFRSRCHRSKDAKEKADEVLKWLNSGKFNSVSIQGPPARGLTINNHFMISARDLKIKGAEDKKYWEWFPVTESSDQSVDVAQMIKIWWLDVEGMFNMSRLSPRVAYEIVFEIMLEVSNYTWETPVDLKLTIPNGITLDRLEDLKDKPRNIWIEIPAGEFVTGLNPTGDLKFSLYQHNTKVVKKGLLVKGVTIRPKT